MQPAPPPEHHRLPLPRWAVPVLALTAVCLLPWTLWLTYSLPARHVTQHYDLAWVGFDAALPHPRPASGATNDAPSPARR